jgi:hypothetical protein
MSAQELYEITRGVWKLGLDRARGARYVFAIFEGIVKEVYEPESWQEARVAGYQTRNDLTPEDGKGRIEFVGKVAPEAIRSQYIDKSVANSFAFGAQNPCKYINC